MQRNDSSYGAISEDPRREWSLKNSRPFVLRPCQQQTFQKISNLLMFLLKSYKNSIFRGLYEHSVKISFRQDERKTVHPGTPRSVVWLKLLYLSSNIVYLYLIFTLPAVLIAFIWRIGGGIVTICQWNLFWEFDMRLWYFLFSLNMFCSGDTTSHC